MSFILSITTLFLKIAYYLSRLSQILEWRHCSQETYVFLNFVEKYVRSRWKKKKLTSLQLSLLNMLEHAWMYLVKQDCECTLGPKYSKILDMTGFSICKRYTTFWIYQNMAWQGSEYILGSKYARILNMAGFWICKSYTEFLICRNMAEYVWEGHQYEWICLNLQ